MSRKGTQFNWVGAEVPQARGGMRAHPPKVISMKNTLKINKKEMKIALCSALSSTANIKNVIKRYSKLKKEDIKELPIIVESKIISLKTKEIENSLRNILGKNIFELIQKKKNIRSGKGKLRGRKYKQNAGLLIIIGKDEKLKTKNFEVVNAENLSVTNLAKGGLGRLVLYTENAIKQLENIK